MRSYLPGVLGATLVVIGLALIWIPLGFVAAGAFLLVVDNQIKLPKRPPKSRPQKVEVR